MSKLKVGFVGVMQLCFTGDKQAQLDKGITGLKQLSEKLNFDFFFYSELLITAGDAQKARKALETEKIDFLLVQGTSFAVGDLIPVLAKTDVYLGLWTVKKIQKAGKGLHLYDWTIKDIKRCYKELRSEGLMFDIKVNSPQEADELLEWLKQNT